MVLLREKGVKIVLLGGRGLVRGLKYYGVGE